MRGVPGNRYSYRDHSLHISEWRHTQGKRKVDSSEHLVLLADCGNLRILQIVSRVFTHVELWFTAPFGRSEVKQDHSYIKKITKPFIQKKHIADGIETVHIIRKGQLSKKNTYLPLI